MTRGRNYRKYSGWSKKKVSISKIKPGADPSLNKIFNEIGVPEQKPFEPDSFQIDAVSAIEKYDCLVTAPTGSGKTWIAEQAIKKRMEKKGKTWYGTPLKALTNTIYTQFSNIFGKNDVGILTGDRKENLDSPIIIGTTEILRNQLYDSMHKGTDLDADFVILDEAHFLGDEDRGVVWEEIMIYLPARIPLLMLSATIGNSHQIADWLHSIRNKECKVIEETKRPVPLYPVFFHPHGRLYPLLNSINSKKKTDIFKKVVNYIKLKRPPVLAPPRSLAPMGDILKVLHRFNLLPAIFFLKSRNDCDRAIELVTGEILSSDIERKEKLSIRIEELIKDVPHNSRHKQLRNLEHLAVGAHHSGQLPSWKILIETLMSEGLLDALFATSTVSAGVNFPARTVVFFNSDRYNGVEFIPLDATEFQQMTGRAGRRGKDNVGFAIAVPGKFMDIKRISRLVNAPASDVNSRISINFIMVLNLLLSHKPGQIKELLDKSFAKFQLTSDKKKNRFKKIYENDHKYLWSDFENHFHFLLQEGFVTEEGLLTEDGVWTSQLRIDTPLLVAECFRLNLFPQKNPVMMAALIATFVNERESDDDYAAKSYVSNDFILNYLKIKRGLKPFAKRMYLQGFSPHPLYLQPIITIYCWANGMPWEKVVKISRLAEGDLARLIMRTADNLRHFKNLSKTFPDVSNTSKESIELIMREPVVSYYD